MTRSKNDAEKRLKASPIDIRPPFFEDFPDILGISNWATCHTTANFRIEPDTLEYWVDLWRGEAERYPWFVAEVDGSVIGFAMVLSIPNIPSALSTKDLQIDDIDAPATVSRPWLTFSEAAK